MRLLSLRKKLSMPKTSWQICLLASIGGALSALLIILFTLTIEFFSSFYLEEKENYTSLDAVSRFDLPILGAIFIILFAWITGYKYLRTGIPFVLHRLKVAHGIMPFRNTVNQFVGSAIALSTGFSVGREGPAVHLGAACSSYLGSVLKLPHNSIRTLCACGIAAGISASFNTPIAAVIFVMEVILREYKVHIFIPIMMASIVGSMMTSSVFGPVHDFEFFHKISLGYHHYPALIILGIGLGILAFAFNRYLVAIIKHSAKYHIIPRLMLAAFITGSLGYAVPFAMGTDLSAIDFSMNNSMHIQLLLGLLIAKFIMTISALGLGIPGGIIGPILGIGAISGTCAAVFFQIWIPSDHLASDLALMGMAGFMAATLNAPLAALLAVVELSNQLEVIVPAMVVIATACVASGQFFGNRSIFIMQLEVQKLLYRKPPIEKSLQRIGLLSIMQENLKVTKQSSIESIKKDIINHPNQHIIVQGVDNQPHYYLATQSPIEAEIPIIQQQLIPMQYQATLADAYLALVEQRNGGVYIYGDNLNDVIGVVMFEQIRRYLVEGKLN